MAKEKEQSDSFDIQESWYNVNIKSSLFCQNISTAAAACVGPAATL